MQKAVLEEFQPYVALNKKLHEMAAKGIFGATGKERRRAIKELY